MKDYIVRATAYNNKIRAYAVSSTATVEEARRRQDTWATASAALGRSLTIAGMMGAMLKGEDTNTIKIEGGGPIGAIVVDTNASGHVRGYVSNPHVDFDLNAEGKLDVARAVGTNGTLSVVKDLGLKDYFTGEVPIVSGEISEDFTYYFAKSEQTPSAVGAGVLVNPDHTILAAGGFLVQVMPGADEEVIERLEEHIQALPPISGLIEEGYTPEQLLEKLFGSDDVFTVLDKVPLEFRCRCSKERIGNAISGLGNEEIEDMIEKDGGATATCHFCNEEYNFTIDELEELKQ